MTLPVADTQVGYSPGGDRATVPVTILRVFIPPGGNPDFPSEVTDPAGPKFLAILLPTAGEGLPDDPGETARPGGTFDDKFAARTNTIPERFRASAFGTNGHKEVAITDYSDWFVDKIWILPSPIAFGQIITSKQVAVSVLNAFREESKTLLSVDISALGAGVSILSDPTPETLQPQQDLIVTLEAVFAGPPTISGDVVFSFSTLTVSILATGIRLIVFHYQPDKSIREQMAWFTDIIKARDGIEQRQGLRTTPRQLFRYEYSKPEDAETSRMRTTLLVHRGLTFGIPIWTEMKTVTQGELVGATVIQVNTDNVDHRDDGNIMIFDQLTSIFEDAVIDSFTSSSITLTSALLKAVPEGALVLPLRFGHIVREPSFADYQKNLLVTRVEFETEDNVDLAFADQAALEVEFPVHPEDSLPILNDVNIMRGQQARTFFSTLTRKDSQIGIPLVVQRHPVSDIGGEAATKDLIGLAEIRKYRSLMHFLRGSLGSFYVPTFRNDLPVALDFALNATTITIENISLVDLSGFQLPHQSVMLELPDGSQFFAEISSVAELSDTQETITLSTAFDPAITLITAADARISWLELTRVEGDTATFFHDFVGQANLSFNLRTIIE